MNWAREAHVSLDAIQDVIRDVPDFPKPGILFKDITPLLADGQLFREAVRALSDPWRDAGLKAVAGIDARGFIFSAAVAFDLGVGLVPIRKKGKLPWQTIEAAYALEYGSATLELHRDAVQPGDKVLLVDDLLATGGTAAAAAELLFQIGAEVVESAFLIELEELSGRARLTRCPVRSLIRF